MAEPMNPLAGKSGPGKFSVREDLPPSKEYGERKQMQEIVGSAPTATTRGSADPQIGRPSNPMSDVTPLFAPSQRPDEPITAGTPLGAGPGPEALMGQSMYAQDSLSKILAQMLPYDTNGEIAALYEQAVSRGL
jgi:hypothetical protein